MLSPDTDEKIGIAVTYGKQLNCFGLLSRQNEFIFKTTTKSINTDFVIEFLEQTSFSIIKPTVIILDNARIHTANKIKERIKVRPEDCLSADDLFYAVNNCLNQVSDKIKINFKQYC